MTLSVIIPYRPDGGHRDRSFDWVAARWRRLFPNVEVVIGTDDGGSTPGQFNHPLAINRAANQATGDVLLIADADTAFDPQWVVDAHAMIESEEVSWVLPTYYDKLNDEVSDWILDQLPELIIDDQTVTAADREWRGENVCWSGLVMVPRAGFKAVNGYDERFSWWGADDVAFGLAMDDLWGRHHRLEGSAFHLWHPQPKRDTEHAYAAEQNRLVERYKAAAGNRMQMYEVRFG